MRLQGSLLAANIMCNGLCNFVVLTISILSSGRGIQYGILLYGRKDQKF